MRSWLVVGLCLVIVWPVLASESLRAEDAAAPQAKFSDAERTELLADRDGAYEEAVRLGSEGKPAEAIAAGRRMIAIERRVFGEPHEEIAGSLVWLSQLFVAQDDLPSARRTLQEAVAMFGKLPDSRPWQVAYPRLQLAEIDALERLMPEQRQTEMKARRLLQEVQSLINAGKYREAIAIAQQALELRQSLWGKSHWRAAEPLNHLAWLSSELRELDRAEEFFREELVNRKAAVGAAHPEYAQALDMLSAVYQRREDYARALSLRQESLAIRKAAYGEQSNASRHR